jgi:hypothetical protein
LLAGAGVLFWGWQGGNLAVAVPVALLLHQRHRFDPKGLDAGARARLRELCRAPGAATA